MNAFIVRGSHTASDSLTEIIDLNAVLQFIDTCVQLFVAYIQLGQRAIHPLFFAKLFVNVALASTESNDKINKPMKSRLLVCSRRVAPRKGPCKSRRG